MSLPSTCVIGVLPGKGQGGNRSILRANPTAPRKFGKSGSSMVGQFAKEDSRRPAPGGPSFYLERPATLIAVDGIIPLKKRQTAYYLNKLHTG
jgi:hypothetical protein